jgi:hypothetical protein
MKTTCSRCPNPRTGKDSFCKPCRQAYKQEHYANNKQAYLDNRTQQREKIQQAIREAKNVPCADCGVRYPYYVMDFDHRDPSEKLFDISKCDRLGGFRQLEIEIAKCDVVCANCHRERTHKQGYKSEGGIPTTLVPGLPTSSSGHWYCPLRVGSHRIVTHLS